MALLQTFLTVLLVMLPCLFVVEAGPHGSESSTPTPYDSPYGEWDFECTGTSPDECENGGTCLFEVFGNTVCDCPETHIGWYCEISNDCYSDPCQHGGICDIDYIGGHYCACQDGWTGDNCETASDTTGCADVTCENGGTCFHYEQGNFCICLSDFYHGFYCEIMDEHPCDDQLAPCANGGTCVVDETEQHCECTDEWGGQNCTEPYPIASLCDDFCENGGLCYIDYHYRKPACHCAPGWLGEHCSEVIKPTSSSTAVPLAPICENVCANGGTCYIYRNYRPACRCTPEWQGDICTDPVISGMCPPRDPCGANGRCIADNIFGGFKCKCNSGWYGDFCEFRDGNGIAPQSSGIPIGGIVGAAVGSLVLFFVIVAAIFTLNLVRASKTRRSQPPPSASAPLPYVIYDPGVIDDFDGPIRFPAYETPAHRPTKDLYSPDPYPSSKIPRRYTPGPVRNHSHQEMNPGSRHHSSLVRNPGAGAYDYAFEPGPVQARLPPPTRTPANEYDYAYGFASAKPSRATPVYGSSSPVPKGPPPVYSPSRAPSRAPSVAASRVSEHTYQSISEYGEMASISPGANAGSGPRSVKSVGSHHSSKK